METLKKEIPAAITLPYKNYAPIVLDWQSSTGYADGKARRRVRRKKKHLNNTQKK